MDRWKAWDRLLHSTGTVLLRANAEPMRKVSLTAAQLSLPAPNLGSHDEYGIERENKPRHCLYKYMWPHRCLITVLSIPALLFNILCVDATACPALWWTAVRQLPVLSMKKWAMVERPLSQTAVPVLYH